MATPLHPQEGHPDRQDGQDNPGKQYWPRGMGGEGRLSEIDYILGRIEGKVDALSDLLRDHVKKDEAAWERVDGLEKKVMWAAGVVATVVFFFSSGTLGILRKMGIIS
jgi:hypothetical protein